MKKFLIKNYKEILLIIFSCSIVFILTKLYSQTTDNSELIKYKLEQLDKDIDSILKKQQLLDKRILEYKTELNKIDSTIAQVRNQKTIIKEYYKEKGEEITGMKPSQIDSLFHKRYKY